MMTHPLANNDFAELSDAELKKLIAEGSIEAMDYYGKQSFKVSRGETSELEQRKSFLFQAPHGGCSLIMRHIGMLAAMTEDIKMAKHIVGFLEKHGDPAMGYYVYREIEHHTLPAEEVEKWRAMLTSAANYGHIPARRYCLKKKMERFGLFGKVLALPMKVAILSSGLWILLHNPKDYRLPPPKSKL